MAETPKDVLALAKDSGVKIVDLRFCDLPGLMQHFSMPVSELTEDRTATSRTPSPGYPTHETPATSQRRPRSA